MYTKFGTLTQFDHLNPSETSATAPVDAVRSLCTVNVCTGGDLQRMRINYDGNVLWLNVVAKWSVLRPRLRALLVAYRLVCLYSQSWLNISAMNASRLSALEQVREIRDYLYININHPDFKSPRFLRNLRIIRGQNLRYEKIFAVFCYSP